MHTFKKVDNYFMFSKFIRDDELYTIEALDIKVKLDKPRVKKVNGKVYIIPEVLKSVFVVYDNLGNKIDTFDKLKDAKTKYSNID